MTTPALAGPAAGGQGGPRHYAYLDTPQDRLVRKESALGFIRELQPPTEHIGLSLVPWKEVPTDEVIFEYLTGLTDGLAPARAEDAESELAQKDYLYTGQGRASVIDWALKDHYTASDVNRYREAAAVAQAMAQTGQLPLLVSSVTEGFQDRLTRDDALRRRKLDNRMEWLIMSAISTGALAYNDGKIVFSVDYGRPAAQQADNAANDLTAASITDGVFAMGNTTFDPIRLVTEVQEYMYGLYGIIPRRALCSRKFINRLWASDKFIARTGLVVGGTPSSPIDLNYLVDGWGPGAAAEIVSRATGIQFIEYDAVYRTRPIGSKTVTNTRFFPEDKVVFLPDDVDLAEFDTTGIGFGKLLTSPHPEGNWAPGFYEWEDETRDPWGHTRGAGVKAFPIFLHMDKTFAVKINFAS